MTHAYRIAFAVAVVLTGTGCSKGEKAEAHSREGAAKAVQAEAVREASVRRAVDVVGTLAAVDEVTISSEADGDRKSTRLNSSHNGQSRMPSSA